MYADIKDHRLYDLLRLGWCGHSFECRLFGVRTDYYLQAIAPLYVQCDDYSGHFLEEVLFNHVKAHPQGLSLRFGREPHLGGYEGSVVDAVSFSRKQDSLKGNLKRHAGNAIRTFLPFFRF